MIRLFVVITPYMSTFINLPTIQPHHVHPVQPAEPIQPEQPQVEPSTQAGSSTPLQVLPHFSKSGMTEPQEGIRADHEVVEPQP